MANQPFTLEPGDKLARLIKHSVRLIEKQDEVRKILREAVARMVEEKLRAQNGGYLRLREYEHMLAFALRQAHLESPQAAARDTPGKSPEDGELFNALVEKLLKDVDADRRAFGG